jgi:hypothetical protein
MYPPSPCTYSTKFIDLGRPNRIWAIPAIHSDANSLIELHDLLLEHFIPGDRILYLGNYIGYGRQTCETIDELLTFRRLILSIQGVHANDLIFLRGRQEEMLNKLLQLQFAPDPENVLLWMLGNGLASTLQAYGLNQHTAFHAAKEGVMGLTKWTKQVRETIRSHKGHEIFFNHLKQAAYTSEQLLFVHAGLDSKRELADQGDNFWWGNDNFKQIQTAYKPFEKVIRGFDPEHKGMYINGITASLDNGCGFGGDLICTAFDQDGQVFDTIET